MIALVYRDSLPEGTAQELDQLTSGLTGMLYEEHDPDGTHTNITADSLTLNKPNLTTGVTGAIVFQDRLGNITTINRDVDNQSGDSVMTLSNGQAFKIRRKDISGVLYDLVRLGLIQLGPGSGNGIVLYGKNPSGDTSLVDVYHDWSLLSGDTNGGAGARMLIGDDTRSLSPVSLRWRNTGGGFYEWMKTTGTLGPTAEAVTLGSPLDSSQAGYWDDLYVKSIHLAQGPGGQGYGLGIWADIAFSSGDYGGNGAMTWTNIVTHVNAYTTVGPTVTLAYSIVGDVGGTPSDYLKFTLPNSWTIAGRTVRAAIGWCNDNGTPQIGYCQATSGDTFVRFYLGNLANWTGGTTASVYGEITFSING